MRFLAVLLPLVLCTACMSVLCPPAPSADGVDAQDNLPFLMQARAQEQSAWLLTASGEAFRAPARRGMPPQRTACAAAAVGVGALWRCLVRCRHACRARHSRRACLLSQRRGGHAPPCLCL